MNIKTLRRNYDALSLRERYGLLEQAIDRQDDSEATAIVAASPKIAFQLVDFYHLKQAADALQIANLLERLKYQEMFDLFFEHREQIAETNPEKSEKMLDNILLCGYLYSIETDAWKAAGDEFGFDVQGFRQIMADDLMTFGLLELKDEMMRELAFTEDGVRKVLERKKMDSAEMKTLENQTAKYKKILIKAERQAI